MGLIGYFISKIDNNSLDLVIDYKILDKEKVCLEHNRFYSKEAFMKYILEREINVYKHYNQNELCIMSIYHGEEYELIIEIIEQNSGENNSVLSSCS